MPNTKSDKAISALQAVYAALKPLSPKDRHRVLASVRSLLDMPPVAASAEKPRPIASESSEAMVGEQATTTQPVAIRELILDKHPHSHPEMITLFAYYREKYESQPTFSREILKGYYASSRENPPKNYSRDFGHAVRRGWIHEEGENSYITSKGIEAVESGFANGAQVNHPSKRSKGREAQRKRSSR